MQQNYSKGIAGRLVLSFFTVCTQLLSFLGRVFNLNYKAISVIVNLWVQGGLLTISGMLPFVAEIINPEQGISMFSVLGLLLFLIYGGLYVCGFIWLLRHYSLPFDFAFDTCVYDLVRLAGKLKMSYQAVNLLIFVFLWLAAITFNVWMFYTGISLSGL